MEGLTTFLVDFTVSVTVNCATEVKLEDNVDEEGFVRCVETAVLITLLVDFTVSITVDSGTEFELDGYQNTDNKLLLSV